MIAFAATSREIVIKYDLLSNMNLITRGISNNRALSLA